MFNWHCVNHDWQLQVQTQKGYSASSQGLRCKRDIAGYWKPLEKYTTGSTWNCIIWDKYQQDHASAWVWLEDTFTARSFFLLTKAKGTFFKATNDWKPITGPAELRPFVGTGHSGERYRGLQTDPVWIPGRSWKLHLPYIIRIDKRTNWTSIPCLTQGMRTAAPSGDLEQAEMAALRPEPSS